MCAALHARIPKRSRSRHEHIRVGDGEHVPDAIDDVQVRVGEARGEVPGEVERYARVFCAVVDVQADARGRWREAPVGRIA